MLAGKVIGTVTSTVKHTSLEGWKMLVVRTDTEPCIAIDCIGAGIGDTVLITSDGSFAGELTGTRATPVRWSVFGIADENG
ncbi:MAG: EutN/CcmL family microcompartment protein [Planctomycetaceae bacterium]|jgi:ethanolamine utilization protein EutN|nr:EutN/CcmL family microcompartment protein [Planctomycetaceae bacterium]